MNKCEHGQKITSFCASDCCVWKQAAGCEQCMRKYHNHMGTTIYLTEQDIISLVKKYTMDNNIKPKCRLLQQTIYSYFSLIKTELTNSMDVICKNIINQIGYPYLYSNNTLSTYKRLKNKQYKKLLQKDFKSLYELSIKITQKDLARQQSKIYVREMKAIEQFLNNLENMVKNYQQITKNCQQNFTHDSTLINKINDIIRHMPTDSPSKYKEKDSDHHRVATHHSPKQRYQNIPKQSKKAQPKLLQTVSAQQNSLKVGRNPLVLPLSPSTSSRPNYSRDVSIDKRIIKQHRFGSPVSLKQDKPLQSDDKQPPHEKIQPLPNNKEIEINQKKKMLIDLMKQKEDTSKQQKVDINKEQKQQNFKKDKPEQKIINQILSVERQLKVQTPIKSYRADSKSQIEDKLSYNSNNQLQDEENTPKTPFTDVQQHAFTKLPLDEPTTMNQQISQNSFAEQVLIVTVPPSVNSESGQLSSSPLINKKTSMSKYQEYKMKYLTEKKETVEQNQPSLMKRAYSYEPRQDQTTPKQNQIQSIALLVKAIKLAPEQAILHLQAALKLADNNISAAQYLSFLYLQVKRPLDCLHLCNKMIEKRQKAHVSHQMSFIIDNNKAASLNMLGRYSQSILILQQCLRVRQKDYFYKNLGDAYFSVSIYDKAIYNYEKALTINESYDEAQYNLAVVLYIQQNYYNAKLAISKALQEDGLNEEYRELSFHIQTKINQF